MNSITTVGCKLPHGPCMEIGISRSGPGPSYRCAIILGVEDVAPALLVGAKGSRYAVTRVPSDLVEVWFKANAKSRYALDGSVFIIK